MSLIAKLAVGAAATVAGGLVTEKVAAKRLRSRTDPDVDPTFDPPADLTRQTIELRDGTKLAYVERGVGRPLVLLHGVTLAGRIWAPQLHGLAGVGPRATGADGRTPGADNGAFRVIAIDQRGHGSSTVGTEGFGIRVLAADLAEVLDRLDLRDALVVGHSMGGMTALRFAADHPETLGARVAGLGLVATAAALPMPPRVMSRLEVLAGRAQDRLDTGRSLPSLGFRANDASLWVCRLAFGSEPSAAAIEAVRSCIAEMEPEALQRSWMGIIDHDVRDHLADIAIPANVVVGSRDLLTPPSAARAIADGLPGAELELLDGCGHQVGQERPDDLARVLTRLQTRVGGPLSAERAQAGPAGTGKA